MDTNTLFKKGRSTFPFLHFNSQVKIFKKNRREFTFYLCAIISLTSFSVYASSGCQIIYESAYKIFELIPSGSSKD